MIKCLAKSILILIAAATFAGCTGNGKVRIDEIRVGLHNNNVLKIQIDVKTDQPADARVEYWDQKSNAGKKFYSTQSHNANDHVLILCNIAPQTTYAYRIIAARNGEKTISKTYTFKSNALPMFLQEQFKADSARSAKLPSDFADGLMLINKRYAPGVTYLVDKKGTIRWYHMVDGLGFKVAHFTSEHTILSIMGGNDEPTSYGHEILEINLLGDTILHLKKGQNDFRQTIHHEVIKNDKGQLVTLFVDKKIMNLSIIGGGKTDTVSGDGILVMDNTGKKIWSWSVFDALDPLKDKGLLKTKKDWMHANSLNFDKDGNYIISFYNNGQIWKVDAHTGKVIWKFGKGGTIAKPSACDFTQAHAVHINQQGNLMFFDNGVEKQQSGVFALKLDEKNLSSQIDMHINLPKEVFNGRMGSAYMINDTSVLVCCSKRHIVVLTNRQGKLLWTMETAMPTYRAEFIRSKELAPYLEP
ncbi:MAG: aryl-sulfate sulfotransferase [Bacteroidetes bacterium]|nr:aryl-sulfate sulfotransferase [Bacteroidota bacterium]